MSGAAMQLRAVDRTPSVTVDFHFDFVCPWCLIGKRSLDAAVARFAVLRPEVSVKVRWHSHQLLPDTPVDGVPYEAFYLARLGNAQAVAARRAQVQEAARICGVEMAFDRIEVMPNTRAAHDLMTWAASTGEASQPASLIDRLLVGYFMKGEDIGNHDVLERIGLECGLDAAGLADHVAASRRKGSRAIPRSPHAEPISGVPRYVFNSSVSRSGAYSFGAIVDAMLRSMDHQEYR
ncbi:MAG TPA: DsbA family oxidoreductase [Paraburkholderia sp.]|nr:DsbA family oxidoreductase [Paraburkholderia sp.]